MNVSREIKDRTRKLTKLFLKLSLLKKVLLIGAIVLVAYFAAPRIFRGNPQPQYQTAQVERGTLVLSVSDSGQVSSVNNAPVTTQVSGVVENVYVSNGQVVNQGDKIADVVLDQVSQQKQTQALASYLSAQSTLAASQAKMNSLQSALFRANQAFVTDRGVNNPSDAQKADPKYIEEQADWLQAEADYKNQQGVISAAQALASSAWLAYQQLSSTITAPISGTVIGLSIQQGEVIGQTGGVSSNQSNISSSQSTQATSTTSSQKIATIQTGGPVTVTVNLSEVDAPKVKSGARATITFDALPEKTFTGHVFSIDSAGIISSGVTTYPAVITLDSANPQILSNMSATANIITKTRDNVLLVPSGAVSSQGNNSVVRRLRRGRVEIIRVETGDSSDTQTEIVSGLSEGDTVVVGTVSTTRQSSSSSPFRINPFGGGRSTGGGALRPGGAGR